MVILCALVSLWLISYYSSINYCNISITYFFLVTLVLLLRLLPELLELDEPLLLDPEELDLLEDLDELTRLDDEEDRELELLVTLRLELEGDERDDLLDVEEELFLLILVLLPEDDLLEELLTGEDKMLDELLFRRTFVLLCEAPDFLVTFVALLLLVCIL